MNVDNLENEAFADTEQSSLRGFVKIPPNGALKNNCWRIKRCSDASTGQKRAGQDLLDLFEKSDQDPKILNGTRFKHLAFLVTGITQDLARKHDKF